MARTAVDDDAFGSAVDAHRRELIVFGYRMLGSVDDAQDAVQETLTRAWRAADRYDPARATIRTWLYRIATNVCLDMLKARRRRPLPADVGPAFDDPDAPFAPAFEVPWLQPLPDAVLGPAPLDPADVAVERARLRLALVAAMQLLPARQRAVLVLRDVLDLSAADAADVLGTTATAVNSALQRAKATLAAAGAELDAAVEPPEDQRAVVDAYVAAFEAADVEALTRLLHRDVVLEMPPMWNWYRGVADYGGFMARVFRTRGTSWRSIATTANAQPAIIAYGDDPDDGFVLHTLQVFTVEHGAIARTTVFQDPTVLAHFQVPDRLPR